jgi:hypothetical protein
MLLFTAIAAVVLLASAAPAHAGRRFVPTKDVSIQQAIDAASAGDTIWVSSGVHKGPFTVRKPIVLVGDGGPDSTILDGGGATRVLDVQGVHGGAIIGFGIRGGKATSGGGIKCSRDTLFAVEDCNFDGNWEGGLALWQCQEVMIRGSKFRNNQGSGLVIESSTAAILECHFTDNKGYQGGGISLRASKILFPLRESTFERNRAEGSTGGAVNASDSSEVTLANCVFRENSSIVAGGAVAAMQTSRINLSRCRFEKNRAATGGAVHSDLSMIYITICIFEGNRSTAAGAAIGVQGRYTTNVNPIYMSNTFYKNVVEGTGATIFCLDVSPEIRKNIFVVESGQLAVAGLRSSPLYDCNLVHDPTGGSLGSLPATTLVGDPRFCDPEKGDFHLKDLSPALVGPCGQIGPLAKGDCSVFRLQPVR